LFIFTIGAAMTLSLAYARGLKIAPALVIGTFLVYLLLPESSNVLLAIILSLIIPGVPYLTVAIEKHLSKDDNPFASYAGLLRFFLICIVLTSLLKAIVLSQMQMAFHAAMYPDFIRNF
jgi:ABC-type antimicrobial peptide transport system permease subunit